MKSLKCRRTKAYSPPLPFLKESLRLAYLTLALEAAYQIGEKLVSYEIVESVLSRQIDDLEPTLTRNGYRLKDLTEQFDAKPAEIKALFSNTLESTRTAELRDKMLRAGLPI